MWIQINNKVYRYILFAIKKFKKKLIIKNSKNLSSYWYVWNKNYVAVFTISWTGARIPCLVTQGLRLGPILIWISQSDLFNYHGLDNLNPDSQSSLKPGLHGFLSGLCHSPTVPNLLPNEEECKKFESRAYSCWGEHESCKFFIWARFFLDNSKIKIRHVRSQVDKVWLYLRMTMNERAK